MNKSELISAIKEKTGATAAETEAFYSAFWTSVQEALANGDAVALAGVGTFKVKERAEKEGINPLTKEKIKIAAKKVVAFKPGKSFDEKVNK